MNHRTGKHYVGIDVCKSKLDVSCPALPRHEVFSNTHAGLRGLFEKLASLDAPAHLVVEPTGGYERLLLEACFANGTAVSRVNALRVRSFAQARGTLAKTDKVDAEGLAAFGTAFSPLPAPAPSENQKILAAAARRRDRLVANLTAEKNALEKAFDPFVIKDIRASIAFLERHIKACENRLDAIIKSDGQMSWKRARMESVKGVGATTSALLLAGLPELGTATDNGICALVGVAPQPRQWPETRTTFDSWRAVSCPPRTLYARDVSRALQPCAEGVLPTPHCEEQTAPRGLGRGHEEAHPPAQPALVRPEFPALSQTCFNALKNRVAVRTS